MKKFKLYSITLSLTVTCVIVASLVLYKPRPAYPQCDNPISSAIALGQWVVDGISFLQSFQGGVGNFIDVDITTGETELDTRLNEFDQNTRQGMADWWQNDYKPALEDRTEQISVVTMEHTRQKGSMMDAQIQDEILARQLKRDAEATRELMPSEGLACQADTNLPGMVRQGRISENIARASANDARPRAMAAVGTPEAGGALDVIASKYDEYQIRYCPAAGNGGNSGCPADAPRPDADITMGSSFLWGEKMSFDLTIPGNEELYADLKYNFVDQEPFVPIPNELMTSPIGIEAFNRGITNAARKQAIYAVIGPIMADRVAGPATSPQPEIRQILLSAGLDPAEVVENPSVHEARQALTKYSVMQPEFIEQVVDNPNEMAKDSMAARSLSLHQMLQTYYRKEQLAVLMGTELAVDLETNKLDDGFSDSQ